MHKLQIVIDTNVLVAALRSRRGASYRLLLLLGSDKFVVNISVPLVLEYESVVSRLTGALSLTRQDIDDILDYICFIAHRQQVFYLWRPFLKDPKDDMVLELAVAANCDFIITYNKTDFANIEHFGVSAVTPQEFLQKLGELP
jgi:putative PIN family toxin of toxin-antitoxin system